MNTKSKSKCSVDYQFNYFFFFSSVISLTQKAIPELHCYTGIYGRCCEEGYGFLELLCFLTILSH